MPQRLFLPLCLAATLLLAACCGPKQQNSDASAVFEKDGLGGIVLEGQNLTQEIYPDVADTLIEGLLDEAKVYFIAHYPQGVHEKADAAIRAKAGSALGGFILDLSPTARPTGETTEESPPVPARLYPAMITYTVTESGKNALTVNFCVWSYLGGAHENWYYSALSVDRLNGEVITLNRLFRNARSIERTARWLSEGERASYERNSGETDESAVKPLRINVTPSDISMERILLTPDGLDILFAPYEKGSFALGDVTARVPKSEFKRLGISTEFWGN